jgi:hypothetical protein
MPAAAIPRDELRPKKWRVLEKSTAGRRGETNRSVQMLSDRIASGYPFPSASLRSPAGQSELRLGKPTFAYNSREGCPPWSTAALMTGFIWRFLISLCR